MNAHDAICFCGFVLILFCGIVGIVWLNGGDKE